MVKAIWNRDRLILDAATHCAIEDGFQWITRERVAARAKVGVGTVNSAFRTMRDLKRAVLQHAVDTGIVEIVAQGLAEGHPITKAAPQALRDRAASYIMTS